MGNSLQHINLRWYLVWLALLFLLFGFWVPIPLTLGFDQPSAATPYQWYCSIFIPLLMVVISPIMLRFAWPKWCRALLLVYLLSAIWMCIATLFPPTPYIARHIVWIISDGMASLAFLLPTQLRATGFQIDSH